MRSKLRNGRRPRYLPACAWRMSRRQPSHIAFSSSTTSPIQSVLPLRARLMTRTGVARQYACTFPRDAMDHASGRLLGHHHRWFRAGGDQRAPRTLRSAVTLSGVIVQILKRGFGRRRPWNVKTDKPLAVIKLPDPFSFPSGHSAAITAVTATISLYKPILTPFLLPIAALVAASRVKLLVHFLGDVLAGASIGLAGAIAAWGLILR